MTSLVNTSLLDWLWWYETRPSNHQKFNVLTWKLFCWQLCPVYIGWNFCNEKIHPLTPQTKSVLGRVHNYMDEWALLCKMVVSSYVCQPNHSYVDFMFRLHSDFTCDCVVALCCTVSDQNCPIKGIYPTVLFIGLTCLWLGTGTICWHCFGHNSCMVLLCQHSAGNQVVNWVHVQGALIGSLKKA